LETEVDVESKRAADEKILRLIGKGVEIPNPFSVDIGDEVDADHISGEEVKIYPGCRIYGEKTVISGGSKIGREGPVTIEDCQLGRSVELKGGYFKNSVFLEKANMASGAHVREGCILEEQAGGAHCVGLKQTILLPFVTLGSLINFCDCLMAGGTSRKNHSEVGSAYIHFNFTPDGDKTTPSLIGDVSRGVMLNQPPIFLGGQGGIVGPVRIGFGNVVAAGTILRNDVIEENKLIVGKTHRGKIMDATPKAYPRLDRVVENNVIYIANLLALEQWYIHVRHEFFLRQEFGELIYRGVLENLALAKAERLKRLKAMAGNISSSTTSGIPETSSRSKMEFGLKISEIFNLLCSEAAAEAAVEIRDRFLTEFPTHTAARSENYIDSIQGLPLSVSKTGTEWLDGITTGLCLSVKQALPAMGLFVNTVKNRKEG
jgi:bifunctional UDP-N-acetylglucosamine pyrophosphorylase / glucosamine-1-phosphate N-acetyltransferase